jgi:hypothetical protein
VNDGIERELKLAAADEALLDRLAAIDRLGEFEAAGRHRELQRNSFFDTASRALAGARIGFRRRTIEGQRLATWTLKADARVLGGVTTRSEIELQLDPDMPPALAIGALRDAARSRGAAALAEAVADALAGLGLECKVDVNELWRASDLVDEYIGDEPVTPLAPRIAVRAAEYDLPAGLVAALDVHLRAHAAGDRIDDVLAELEHPVRANYVRLNILARR